MLTLFFMQVHGDEPLRAEGGPQNVDPIIVGPYPFALRGEEVHFVASIRDIVNMEFREFISRGCVEVAPQVSSNCRLHIDAGFHRLRR